MCVGRKSAIPKSNDEDNNNLYPRTAQSPTTNGNSKMPPNETYNPPPGPPPGRSTQESYAPPPGPPPSHSGYAPPPGPPPSHSNDTQPEPIPAQAPYHDWQTAVPDTSLLPPPPSLGNQRSATNNATEQEAEQGEEWCRRNPFTNPIQLAGAALEAIEKGEIGIIRPRSYQGALDPRHPGVWSGKTKSSTPDSCITSSIPLYSVYAHSPLRTEASKTIYYEVKISPRNRSEVSLALGYGAPPYPTFRLPGWHRGCLAVHGDDGSKYVNDLWGGRDFTSVFKPGETLGIGMAFAKRDVSQPPAYSDLRVPVTATTPINVEIFFTRNGKRDGGWNLHEEGDAQEDLPVTGLEGFNDLYAAVGVFGSVEFEIVFNRQMWMYRP